MFTRTHYNNSNILYREVYWPNGNIKLVEWRVVVPDRINGVAHYLYGPAFTYWAEDNKKLDDYWYINGVEYTVENHPFCIFRKQYKLPETYDEWPEDMKILFKLTLKLD